MLYSEGPTPEELVAGFTDENGNLRDTASLGEVFRVIAPGQVDLETLAAGVLEPKDEASLNRLRGSIPDGEERDISQLLDAAYKGRSQQQVNIASVINSTYGPNLLAQVSTIPDGTRSSLNFLADFIDAQGTRRLPESVIGISSTEGAGPFENTRETRRYTNDEGVQFRVDSEGVRNVITTNDYSGYFGLGAGDDVIDIRSGSFVSVDLGPGADNVTSNVGTGIPKDNLYYDPTQGTQGLRTRRGPIEGITDVFTERGEPNPYRLSLSLIDFDDGDGPNVKDTWRIVEDNRGLGGALGIPPEISWAENFTETDELLLSGSETDYDVELLEAENGEVYTIISRFTSLSGGSAATNPQEGIPSIGLEVPTINTGKQTIGIIEGDFLGSDAIKFNQ